MNIISKFITLIKLLVFVIGLIPAAINGFCKKIEYEIIK